MAKRYGYIKAKKYQEVEIFSQRSKADKVLIDLVANSGIAENKSFEQLKSEVKKNDTIIITSFSNLFNSMEDSLEFINFLKKKGVHLKILDTTFNEESLLKDEGYKYLVNILKLSAKMDRQSLQQRSQKTGRKSNGYPDGFYEVLKMYLAKEIKAVDAAKMLNITEQMFYVFKRYFY